MMTFPREPLPEYGGVRGLEVVDDNECARLGDEIFARPSQNRLDRAGRRGFELGVGGLIVSVKEKNTSRYS